MQNSIQNNQEITNFTSDQSLINPDISDKNNEGLNQPIQFPHGDFNLSENLNCPQNEEVVAFGGDGSSPKSDKSILNKSDSNPDSNTNIIEDDDLDNEADALQWRSDTDKQAKSTICLWYDGDAENAARFYAQTFPDSFVGAVHLAPEDFPAGKKGDVLTVEFTVMGIPCLGLNGGPGVKHNWAFSFQVATVDQAETDRYWNAIVGNGGAESACGWCKDKWGLSWQITPIALSKAITDPDPAAAKRAFDAMMEMTKIDIAAIESAQRGR